MRTRRLITTAIAVGCLGLGACGSDDGSPAVSLPSSVSLPDRSTTVPPETGGTETPTTETPTTETPTTETPTTETPDDRDADNRDARYGDADDGGSGGGPGGGRGRLHRVVAVAPVALAVIGLIAFLVMRRSRRAAAAWQQQTAAAFDESTRLATHLAAVAPEGAAMVAAQDAGQIATLAATLSALGAKTEDEAQRRAIRSVHDQLQVLHGVVDGIAMGSGPASPAALDYMREQATALHGATARARAEVLPGTPGPGHAASA